MRRLGEAHGYYAHWGWYVDRLADVQIGHVRGVITDREAIELRKLYTWLWRLCDTVAA